LKRRAAPVCRLSEKGVPVWVGKNADCRGHEYGSANKLLAGKRELPELVVPSGYDKLDVFPADFSYRNFDVHLSERKRPTERLLKMSRSLRDAYASLGRSILLFGWR
jgi:hypothetical protein